MTEAGHEQAPRPVACLADVFNTNSLLGFLQMPWLGSGHSTDRGRLARSSLPHLEGACMLATALWLA